MTGIPAVQKPSVGIRAVLTALLLSSMWGMNVVSIKVGIESFPPIWSAFWRMLLAVPVLAWWAWKEGVDLRPSREEWRFLGLLGMLFAVQIMLLNSSVKYTSAAYSAVLTNSAPIFTNLIAHFAMADDRLSRTRLAGLVIAFSGVCITALGRPIEHLAPAPLLGNAIAVLTAALIGVRMVYTRGLVQTINSTRTIFWQVIFSLPVFFAVAWAFEPPLNGPIRLGPVVAILYQAIGVAGIGFILWVRLLREYPAGLISVFAFPTPLFGVLFSALIFAEPLSPMILLGGAAVAVGILIVTWKPRRPPVAAGEYPGDLRRAA